MPRTARFRLHHPGFLQLAWIALLFVALLLAAFLHEDGHGLGARLDGVHVSTGFNKVGDPGKYPDDPDFRSASPQPLFWAGLLGPVASWLLALGFTIWLYRLAQASWAALSVGALAVANALVRFVPMALFFGASLRGQPYLEDEVAWGIWFILRFLRPDLAAAGTDYHALLELHPAELLSFPAFWIPPLFSLTISAILLALACVRNDRLWRSVLRSRVGRVLFVLAPVAVYLAAALPALNWLDGVVRINW